MYGTRGSFGSWANIFHHTPAPKQINKKISDGRYSKHVHVWTFDCKKKNAK